MGVPIVHQINTIKPLGETVLVTDMNFKERFTSHGIILLNDDGKSSGIRPRWGKVYAVGPKQNDIVVGEWILISHGRWTRGVEIQDATGKYTLRKVDPKDILLRSDEQPNDDTMSDAVQSEHKTR